SEFLPADGAMKQLGAVEQRFGGYASFVQADSPDMPFFRQQRLHPGPAGQFGGMVACRSPSYYNEIVYQSKHSLSENHERKAARTAPEAIRITLGSNADRTRKTRATATGNRDMPLRGRPERNSPGKQ